VDKGSSGNDSPRAAARVAARCRLGVAAAASHLSSIGKYRIVLHLLRLNSRFRTAAAAALPYTEQLPCQL